MAQSAKLERVFETLHVGRRFRKRPAQKHVQEFLRHLAASGAPHLWPSLSTTEPSPNSEPVLLQEFRIPDKFRRGLQSRAPCPICSAFYPKYEHGYLAWHPDDGLIRAIGHECGKDFFDGDAFANALNVYELEQAEKAARKFLAEACPTLTEVLVRRMFLRRDLRANLRMREEFVATVTKKAIDRLAKNVGSDGTLSIETASTRMDEKGQHLVARHVVGKLAGASAMKGGEDLLSRLERPYSLLADGLADSRDERAERLAALTAQQVVAVEKEVRDIIVAEAEAAAFNDHLAALLSPISLLVIGRWGAHSDCPHPFWVARFGADLHAGKGIKPVKMTGTKRLSLPVAMAD